MNGIDRDTYLKERTLLVDLEAKGIDQHDKAVLAISSGALALSITYLDKIAPSPTEATYPFVLVAWVCFVVSIVVILVSFLVGQRACRVQRDILEDEYLNPKTCEPKNNSWSTWTTRLNVVSCAALIVGIVTLCVFCFLNLPTEGERMAKENKGNPDKASAGYVPPKTPAVKKSKPPPSKSTEGKSKS